MDFSQKDFQVLNTLTSQDISTQRQLSELSGISLGQVNYVLKSLMKKGLVKIGNFQKSQHKIGYVYLLTPKGIEAKSRLATNFVVAKLKEYNSLKKVITSRLATLEKKGHIRIVFVGPEIVKGFVDSIIKENNMKLDLAGYCRQWEELKNFRPESFDIFLLFDGNATGIKIITEDTGISRDKLLPLW
jgi:EPS-associated MarR family transcriptional regulator